MANVASNATSYREGENAHLHLDYTESKSTATNCIRFIERLPVPSGALAGQDKLIKLMPWQKELIKGIWPEVGHMRNEVLICIPRRKRQDGKSRWYHGVHAVESA